MRIDTIADQLFFMVSRLEGSTPNGRVVGTGFVVQYHSPDEQIIGDFLVTCRHLVEDACEVTFSLPEQREGQPDTARRHQFRAPKDAAKWHFHPDPAIDVAVLNLGGVLAAARARGVEYYYRSIGPAQIPKASDIESFNSVEDISFVGFPNNLFDQVNMLPIVRRGATATPPAVDFNGKPIFLVDAAVFPGSSGSPVLIAQEGAYRTRQGLAIGSRAWLLGILASVAVSNTEGAVEFEKIPTMVEGRLTLRQPIGLGFVFKTRTVIETIEELIRLNQPPSIQEAGDTQVGS